MSDSKGKEPDVLFVGDSLVQLLHEFEVNTVGLTLDVSELHPLMQDTTLFLHTYNEIDAL